MYGFTLKSHHKRTFGIAMEGRWPRMKKMTTLSEEIAHSTVYHHVSQLSVDIQGRVMELGVICP